ncbi:hypothetical protein ACJIZ3_019253 [Penstemon smallii]|uniref:Uncharacterized protein n=1 Tax=Penstemon smallii TaxID=265156 RepID=A0ABD3T0M6_9LAMI
MMFIKINRSVAYMVSRNSSSVFKSHVYFSLCFSTTTINTSISEFLTHKHHFSPQAASRVASVLTHLKDPENADSILSFLKEAGFSRTQLEKTVKTRPQLLMSSIENTIKPKFKIFQDLGLSASETAAVMSSYPAILHCSANNKLIPSLSMLKKLLGSDEKVTKVLKKSPSFLVKDLGKTWVPNINFLKSCGINMEQITMIISYHPSVLMHSPERLRKWVDKADEMGVDRSSKMFIHAFRVASSMNDESWELKVQAFRDLGFSEDDILRVFRRAPIVFSISEKKMKKVKELLLATGKYDMSSIVNRPTSLCCSIDNRYKPRLQVLGVLEGKKLITKWPSLGTLHTISDEQFYEKFVGPYLNDVGDVYKAFKSELDGKSKAKLVAFT